MKIEMQKIKIRDLVDNYLDSQDNGVVAFHGLLNVRPAFQREFIYKDEQRNEVMRTVKKGFPLNVMYWAVSDNPNNIDISNIKNTEDPNTFKAITQSYLIKVKKIHMATSI